MRDFIQLAAASCKYLISNENHKTNTKLWFSLAGKDEIKYRMPQ